MIKLNYNGTFNFHDKLQLIVMINSIVASKYNCNDKFHL